MVGKTTIALEPSELGTQEWRSFSHDEEVSPMASEQIRTAQPVTNTVHNLIQTLSVKLDTAARLGLYQEDAANDGCDECAQTFKNLAGAELEAIDRLMKHLAHHIPEETAGT